MPALIVDVTRGSLVESRHEVDVVVVDRTGRVDASWGEPHRMVLARSALKPIQALPLVSSGAADELDLSDVELALACASHSGEAEHVATVDRWLARVGLNDAALACGGDPGPVHNNCSGKHAGFLTLCRHLGLDTVGYLRPGHPLQREHVTPAIADVCGVHLSGQVPGVDGCGIPVWAMPLSALASGWAELADRADGRRLLDAMVANPWWVAGTGRTCTCVMSAARDSTAVKVGAEGVYCASLREAGLGVALKVRDGAGRAAGAALEFVLDRYGVYDPPPRRPITNVAGADVGEIVVRG